jgi:hypothetical protein
MIHHRGGDNMDSILNTIKIKLGLNPDYDTAFDNNIIPSINSAFVRLQTLGIGPQEGAPFHITGSNETWDDFFGSDDQIDMVIDYVYLKTKLSFDIPSTSFVIEAYKHQIEEMEFIFIVLTTDKKKKEA